MTFEYKMVVKEFMLKSRNFLFDLDYEECLRIKLPEFDEYISFPQEWIDELIQGIILYKKHLKEIEDIENGKEQVNEL